MRALLPTAFFIRSLMASRRDLLSLRAMTLALFSLLEVGRLGMVFRVMDLEYFPKDTGPIAFDYALPILVSYNTAGSFQGKPAIHSGSCIMKGSVLVLYSVGSFHLADAFWLLFRFDRTNIQRRSAFGTLWRK
mgnify:CR=1 FL=1